MGILGKMLPYVLRVTNQPYLKIKFKKTFTPYVGKQKSMCVRYCACPHVFAHVHTHRAIFVGDSNCSIAITVLIHT